MGYTFLFKENDTNNRDCVKYIKLKDLSAAPTPINHHYNIYGPCFSMSLKPKYDFDNITTVLSKDEFDVLCSGKYDESTMNSIIEKLNSDENKALFEQVQQEEIEFLMEEYSINEDDVEYIFDNYYLSYRDRGVVSYIFRSIEDAGYEEAHSLGYATDENDRWFDYEKFGEDLLNEEQYLELSSGAVVYMNY